MATKCVWWYNPNGIEYGRGSHVSVFVGLLKGEHDDQLGWPLELDVAIDLLNWREDKEHHERTVTINSEYYRVTKNGIKISPSSLIFIHHSLLSYYSSTNTEYLQNNSLRPGAHNQKERPTQYICSIPTYDQNPLKFLSRKVHVWKSKPSPYLTRHTNSSTNST